MFGRAFQIQLVKRGKIGDQASTINLEDLDYEKIGEIAKDTVKTAAIATVVVGAAFFAMGTVRQILVNLTNPANYR